jgi:hypothetical protein
MEKATHMMESERAARGSVGPIMADSPPPRRRTGRRVMIVAATGMAMIGLAWTFAAIRAGMAGAEHRGRKSRRRQRRHR